MHDPERAAQAYQAGDQLWRQGQPEAALASLITAIALHPEHPNAKNFAGWLLTTRHRHEPAAVAQGLALLAEAHALAPADDRPLYNLVEALAAAGQRTQALAVVDAAIAARPHAAEPYNLRGWLRGLADGADDPKCARDDFTAAIDRQTWYGDAHFNLGRLSLATADFPRAELAFAAAIASRRCSRAAEAHLRLGELLARRGRLRRALGHLRRSAELDTPGALGSLLAPAVQAVGQALLGAGRYLLHALDEARRSAELEAGSSPPSPGSTRALARRARELLPRLGDPALAPVHAAVQQVLACAEADELLPQYADRSPTLVLELASASAATPDPLRAELHAIAERWIAVQRSLYDQLIGREESEPEAPAAARISELAAHKQWDLALAELTALPTSDDDALLWRASKAESLADLARRAGARQAARALDQRALADYQRYAAGATSGGEGTSRMLDVDRLRRRLARPDDEHGDD